MNYYEILGISPYSSAETIKTAYRTLCKKYHPDVNRGIDTTGKMQAINTAYDILSDVEKRKNYDNTIVMQNSQLPQTRQEQRKPPTPPPRSQSKPISIWAKMFKKDWVKWHIDGIVGKERTWHPQAEKYREILAYLNYTLTFEQRTNKKLVGDLLFGELEKWSEENNIREWCEENNMPYL